MATAVRYGRVPKRSRELSGNDESPMNARVTAHNNTSTPTTPVTPTTPQLCSVASPPDLTTATATATTDPSELPSTADLSTVYDVICRVSQAHRTHSTYTEENAPNILRKPIQLPDDTLLDTDYEVSETIRHLHARTLRKFHAAFRVALTTDNSYRAGRSEKEENSIVAAFCNSYNARYSTNSNFLWLIPPPSPFRPF